MAEAESGASGWSALVRRGFVGRTLNNIETVGNRLPDPALLFLLLLVLTWIVSAVLAPVEFAERDPRTGDPMRITNQLTGAALATFLVQLVPTFTEFAPLGVVLVALLGVGVAEKTGFINVGLKLVLGGISARLLTPMLILAAILSHAAADAGYVMVVALGGVIFYSAGRHPLAGISAAFAGFAGGFSANFIPPGIDPLLQLFTQQAARSFDAELIVNPLGNLGFTALSSLLVIGVGWYVTDRVIEPRLQAVSVDSNAEAMPKAEELTGRDRRGFWAGAGGVAAGLVLLAVWALPVGSSLRSDYNGSLFGFAAPLRHMMVPLFFLLFLIPGVVHGYVAGTVKTHRDIVGAMTGTMNTMAYYLVMAFFAAQFFAAFNSSGVGLLIALKGANLLRDLAPSPQVTIPPQVTIVGVILLTSVVNLFLTSASAKWAVLSGTFVPILMGQGIAPELTQAAYRVGDSVTNVITPLMPYLPLVIVLCQRYVKTTGIGTVASLMLPHCIGLLVGWTLFLLAYWMLGLPLGLQASYTYP